MLSCFDGSERKHGVLAMQIADPGTHYAGPSQPRWYRPEDLRELFAAVQPPETTVSDFAREVFDIEIPDGRVAARLDAAAVKKLHEQLVEVTDGGSRGRLARSARSWPGISAAITPRSMPMRELTASS
jgi:hypothetical protein